MTSQRTSSFAVAGGLERRYTMAGETYGLFFTLTFTVDETSKVRQTPGASGFLGNVSQLPVDPEPRGSLLCSCPVQSIMSLEAVVPPAVSLEIGPLVEMCVLVLPAVAPGQVTPRTHAPTPPMSLQRKEGAVAAALLPRRRPRALLQPLRCLHVFPFIPLPPSHASPPPPAPPFTLLPVRAAGAGTCAAL